MASHRTTMGSLWHGAYKTWSTLWLQAHLRQHTTVSLSDFCFDKVWYFYLPSFWIWALLIACAPLYKASRSKCPTIYSLSFTRYVTEFMDDRLSLPVVVNFGFTVQHFKAAQLCTCHSCEDWIIYEVRIDSLADHWSCICSWTLGSWLVDWCIDRLCYRVGEKKKRK